MKRVFTQARLLFLMAFLCGASFLVAQTTVTGTITDQETGDPLIGASILAVGTSTGTITDFDGNYTLNVPAGVNELQYSYTGYATVNEAINGRTTIDLALQAGELLSEVVVVGYGSVKKEDLTGSVSTIEEETFNKGAIVSPTNLIAGKVAGVNISSGSGNPGEGPTVRIRGGTSINASNDPLYVIDGVPLSNDGVTGGRSPLNFLNPDDIASMTVLKDASAAAIYGSRGANGVILITTKKGKAGTPSISYRAEGTVSNVINRQQNLNAEDFRNVVTFAAPARLSTLGTANTNWFDELTQTGYGTQQNLSISGGGQTNTYRVSAGYQQLEGVIRGAETERISLNVNFTQELFDEKLIVGASLKGANSNNIFDPGVINAALDFDPTQPIYDPANTAYAGFFEYGNSLAPRNPVSATEQISNTGRTYRGIGNLDLEYKFDDLIPGLSYKAVVGFDVNSGQNNRFVPTTFATLATNGYSGEFNINNALRTSKLFDTYLTYATDFGNQRASLQVGYSYQDFNFEGPSIQGQNLSTDAFGTANPGVAEDIFAYNSVVENRLISFFGRLNYNIDERYLFTASLRRDGSSRFGPSNRWGLFPSAALAWRILQEDFAAGLAGTFSDLKLRIGYGVTGNQDFGDYLYLPVYQYSDQRTQYQFGDRFVPTIRPNAYDANLKWEETASLNVGLDFGFFNNRLSGILEYYQKTTDDLLFTVNVPAGTNLSDRVTTNIGALENQGVELTLNGVLVDQEKFGLDLTGNFTFQQTEITRLDGSGSADIQTGGIAGGVGNTVQLLRVGATPYSFYLYQQKYDEDGRPLRDGVDYNEDGIANNLDIYEDLNGDGVLNDQDLTINEAPMPDVLLGFTANARYGKLNVGVTLRGNLGNYVYNNAASNGGNFSRIDLGANYVSNVHASAVYTRFDRPQYFSDYYLEDGSFLRLDNLSASYDFGQVAGDALNLRVYATAQNLFLLTNYSGNDPEGNGIDNSPFPRARIYTIGARVGL
ncbi:iron complex outermembrane receptor protein [Lewinella marina]|uniref:SusC/RagA family TonB-linked outer membrane protein n=1 Tax=Neolewinella marina TaxID=438751 RepID=A0A2G0CEN2_9BACT|nr:TonB-dependent receptor [Neolewinella marina]NJB87250.1 iron complex outermembrane receptor protein [Neolewinella marina]PHK98425.1 SusC/RagA family TonB-linked outer membrane protein [Neolewinella marina]